MAGKYTTSQVCGWFGLNPVTVRKWMTVFDDPLRLDASSDEGSRWRRFSFADVVRFQLLKALVSDLRVDILCAVSVTNRLFDIVAEWSAAARSEAELHETWAAVEPFWLILLADGCGGFRFAVPQGPGRMLDELALRQTDGAVVVNLSEIVRRAVLSTEKVYVEAAAPAPESDAAAEQPSAEIK